MPEKIVRDKLPSQFGVTPRIVEGNELRDFLVDKLREETDKLIKKISEDWSTDSDRELIDIKARFEMGDVIDVVERICMGLGGRPSSIAAAREIKRVSRGAFDMAYIIDVPHGFEDRAA